LLKARFISLLPLERGRVLFLLTDRLMEYNASENRATVLRLAEQTGLGRFVDLIPAREDGAWVSGRHGLAKLPPPIRKLQTNSIWKEFLAPADLSVQNLQRPIEDDQGGVTLVADPTTSDKRVVVHFDGRRWQSFALPGESVRQAWRGANGEFWAMTANALYRFTAAEGGVTDKESVMAGQFRDAAVQPDGVFWIASTEGLLRYTPLIWRGPPQAPQITTAIHAIREDAQGRVWFASDDALIVQQNEEWSTFDLPQRGEAGSPETETEGLFCMADGQIAFSMNDMLWLFDTDTQRFHSVRHPSGFSVKLLGQLGQGPVYARTVDSADPDRVPNIEIFNGESFKPAFNVPCPGSLGPELFCIYPAHTGDIWVGGSSGLARYHENRWEVFGPAEGYQGEGATTILELAGGRIWCGARNRIMEFDGKKWMPVRTGFDRVISMFMGQDGSIWVSSTSGLYRYWNGSWMANGVDEGLPSSVVYAFCEDSRGQRWIGTPRGFRRYYPGADPDPPKTSIETADNRVRATSAGLTTLAFSGQDKWKVTPPERLLFSYRLDSDQWSAFSPSATATFTNLPSGPHRFSVRAMDRNWNIDPDPATLEFVEVLPWFKEPRLIAVSLLGLAVALGLAGVALNRHLRLVRSYAEVERQVAERSRELELAHQELLHSQKMRALGTMAAGIAHDFNSILSIIKGSAQIIEANLHDADKIRTRVQRIKTMVDQGSVVVRALLGFSRGTDSRRSTCNLRTVIEEAVRQVSDRFSGRIALRVEAEADLPPIPGASELAQQMVLNLLLNAADAMEGYQGRVAVRTGWLERLPPRPVLQPASAARYAFVQVSDTGCGITPEVMPRIFEPFYTTKALSTRRGAGLGLSMVYEFAKEMGYGLAVESVPGHGSTFTIILPCNASSEEPPGEA
jgi:signal transduction histidine kinase/ligand-binding sensor domain-containing protein